MAENVGRRDPLSAGDLCFTKMNYTNSDGFQIPWLIVQLEDDFHGADTRNPDLKLHCKWSHSKNGKYGGVWEEWKNPADGLQWNSRAHGDDHQAERGSIEMTGQGRVPCCRPEGRKGNGHRITRNGKGHQTTKAPAG